MKLLRSALLIVLFLTTAAHAQLANFNLFVTKTDETCSGNGSLHFSVSNLTPNSTLIYKVYALPDTTTPIAVLNENHLGSLTAGSYRVVAIQALGSNSNSKQKDVTIVNKITPFDFSVSSGTQNCSAGGSIIVNTITGTAASYQILSGPATRPLQSSNTFENMPAGTYNVRAYDICGAAKVKTYTLSVLSSYLTISSPMFPELVTQQCDSITVNNIVTPSEGSLSYPLTVQHVVNSLSIGGEATVISQTINSGPPASLTVSAVLPRYMTESYTYDLKITDKCNTVYEKNGNIVDPDIVLALSTGNAPCAEKFLVVNTSRFTSSFTINFLSAPEGFSPAAFNPSGTGPFTGNVTMFGSADQPVPFGNYVLEITDVCGRFVRDSINIQFIRPVPIASGVNNGCFSEFGKIVLKVPDQKLVSAVLTGAPGTYNQSLPQDMTSLITSGGLLVLNDMPLGVYTLKIKDDCGFEYDIEVEVPPFVELPFVATALPSCGPGYGSVRINSGNGVLTSVNITQAPASFGHSLPYNVSSNIIANGYMYMDSLPEGDYVFTATDNCGIVKQLPVTIEGYDIPENAFEFTPNCGSFSVAMNDTSNGTQGATYWLQRYSTFSNTWGHPVTGIAYPNGAVPNDDNSLRLLNNVTRNNLNFIGSFRIIKKFETFTNASDQPTICISVLGEFTYNDILSISSAYSLACAGNPNDVYLDVQGHPTSIKIVQKDGQPFVVDNGTDNIFRGLEPAEYTFEVEDNCGNIVTQWFNVQSLPSIADATQPQDMHVCVEPGANFTNEFHLTDQNAQVLGDLQPAMYTVSYHLTQADADNGVNALPEYYTNVTNGQVIYVRLVHNEIDLCHGTTSFRLFVGEYQEPVIARAGMLCEGNKITLTADAGYSSYLWSTGETTSSIQISDPGTYTVVVEKAYGNQFCDGYTEIVIEQSGVPTIKTIETQDWTNDENMITIHAEGIGRYEYSIDGINYQDENVFTGLKTGVYQVYVRDANGCGMDVEEVVLMTYPNFFTPNGDGYHDRWRIEYAVMEPHIKVAIFDRYGKLITTFGATSEGWDGTLNGIQLPSTDYWFVVTREDGRQLKGHFAMLR